MSDFRFTTYEYQPLPTPTSTRVICLDDNPTNISEIPLIKLSLQVIDLNDNPTFDALSYTWGTPFPPDDAKSEEYLNDKKRPIAVNNRLFLVSKNLHDFLSHVRDGLLAEDERFEPYNKTRLIQAAEEGRVGDAQSHLSDGADLTACDKFGETELHYAAENGHLEILKMLVYARAYVSRRDRAGRTPLDCTLGARRGQFNEVASFLKSLKPED